MNFNDLLRNKWAIDVDIDDVEQFLSLCEDHHIEWCDGRNALFHLQDVRDGIIKGQPRFLYNVNGKRGLSITDRRFRYGGFGAFFADFEEFDEYTQLPEIQESCIDSLLQTFT